LSEIDPSLNYELEKFKIAKSMTKGLRIEEYLESRKVTPLQNLISGPHGWRGKVCGRVECRILEQIVQNSVNAVNRRNAKRVVQATVKLKPSLDQAVRATVLVDPVVKPS
jgi:hypothetical protein